MLINKTISREDWVSGWFWWDTLDCFHVEQSSARCVQRLPVAKQFQGQDDDIASFSYFTRLRIFTLFRFSAAEVGNFGEIAGLLCFSAVVVIKKYESTCFGYFIIDKHVRLFFSFAEVGKREEKSVVFGHRQGYKTKREMYLNRCKDRLIRFRRQLRHCLSFLVESSDIEVSSRVHCPRVRIPLDKGFSP